MSGEKESRERGEKGVNSTTDSQTRHPASDFRLPYTQGNVKQALQFVNIFTKEVWTADVTLPYCSNTGIDCRAVVLGKHPNIHG